MSARVVNASDVAAREGDKDAPVSHGSLSKREERKHLVGGILALSRAMRNVARDAWLPGSNAGHIPTNAGQLEIYLTKQLGGKWTVEEKHTHGCTSAYFTAIQNDASANSSNNRLFVKLGKPSTSGRITNAALRNGTCEVECFNRLWSQRRRRGDVERDCAAPVAGMHVPNCRIAESSKYGSKFVVVLDDLVGDNDEHKSDVRLAKPGEVFSVRDVRKLLAGLASMHAAFWGRKDSVPPISKERKADAEALANFAIGNVIKKSKKDGGLIPSGSAADRIVSATRALGGFCRLNDILDDLHPELRTLCHGDAHGGNIYFTGGNGDDGEEEVGLLDWQTYSYGNPIGDVASVLFNCLSKSDFIDHREDLMDAYIQALRRHGVEAYITRDMIVEGLYLKAGYYFSGLLFAFDLVGDDKHQQEMLLEGWKSFNEKAEILDLASNIEKFLHQ